MLPRRPTRRAPRAAGGVCALVLTALLAGPGPAQEKHAKPVTGRGVKIIQHGTYPELRVDGEPFFIHSAAFFYYRIPDDLWERSLEAHRELGINTIDLYIPWNWHEPRQGELDFDGRTHPRRNLRRLLALIAERGFKLIVRPGPVILNEWRHGGYPEWLLERPEYGMDPLDRIEGRYPPLSTRNAADAEGAARGWLENAAHMAHTRRWLAAVGAELLPYLPARTVTVRRLETAARRGGPEETPAGGPLLFVQLDDDLAIGRANYAGEHFWRYAGELRDALRGAGVDVPVYINPTDMRVSAAGSELSPPIGVMGQWYLQPPAPAAGDAAGNPAAPARRVSAQDAAIIEFFAETLKTQPHFPPAIIEYQAGWYTPGDDARPPESPPQNTLVSSRLLMAHGIKGINYFPAQDTLYPAGYETPWTNRHYRWDAALDAAGERQFRALAVQRNARLVERWGAQLAASYKRADFGLVYPLGAFPQRELGREDIFRVSGTVLRLLRAAWVAGLAAELLDPHYQPAEQLLRHAVVLLPVFDAPEAGRERYRLSEKAQQALVEYVRRGGTLVVFPSRPGGEILSALFTAPPRAGRSDSAISAEREFGRGRVLESTKDFYSWAQWAESLGASSARFEAAFATRALREFLNRAGVHPVVNRELEARPGGEVLFTQLATHDGARPLSGRQGGRGLLSVTNLSAEEPAEELLYVLSPRVGALRATSADYTRLALTVPAAESLLLPLHEPLCETATPRDRCTDEVVIAGAELLRAEREGNTLELTFYTPARASVVLQLRGQPRRVQLDEMRPEAEWVLDKNQLIISVPRGPAPHYLRTVKVHLRYTPFVPPKPDPSRLPRRRDFDWGVFDALRLPLADDTSLPTYPPLVAVNADGDGQMLVQATNFDDMGRDFRVNIEGPVRGSAGFGAGGEETRQVAVRLRGSREAAAGSPPPAEESPAGVLRGELEIRSGRDRRSSPIYFVPVKEEGVTPYEYDFDRDGALEYVLENRHLRLIASPAAGGRAVALVDKLYALNLFTSAGGLRDHFAYTPSPQGLRPDRARGRYGLFNRAYRAEWANEKRENENGAGVKSPALRLSYTAADVFPYGATVEKTLRLADDDTLEADYRVALAAPAKGRAAPDPPEGAPPQAFHAVSSVPVVLHGGRTTRFCWQAPPGGDPPAENAEQCEMFVPGRVVTLPAGVRRAEMRSPGRLRLALEWDAGQMVIEMKSFSALLRVEFPALIPGGEAGVYRLRYTVLPVD